MPLLDNIPIGIIQHNSAKKCIYANSFIKEFLNLDCQQLCYNDADEEKWIYPEDLQKQKELTRDLLNNQKESESIARILNYNRGYKYMKINRTVVVEEKISFMHTFIDINNQKLLEHSLKEESLKTEKAYSHKSVFLANMSHEIRTPLNGIIGMLTLLEDTKTTNIQRDYIDMIKECSCNLLTIINDILDFSKLEAGRIVLDLKPMNLKNCIDATNDIILSKMNEKSIDFVSNIDDKIPDYIISDTNRIKQILLNLLSNAAKFTERGRVSLKITKISYTEALRLQTKFCENPKPLSMDSVFIRVNISDTGCGISEEDKVRLFQSFNQLDNHLTTKVHQGTGLGLAITKELVELLSGFVWLDWSECDTGSCFSFVLATDDCKTEIPTSESEHVMRSSSIIIVDDNVINRISLLGILNKWGIKCLAVSNGDEALFYTLNNKYDMGIIDICMPKMDGPTFVSRLREQQGPNKNMPVIALSSIGDKTSQFSKYFKSYLIKPVKDSKLRQIITDILTSQRYQYSDNILPPLTPEVIAPMSNYFNGEVVSKIRILLAEDVLINQHVIVKYLEKMNYSVIDTVENGEQCLQKLRQKEYDILLLDIRMPILNGEVVNQKLIDFYKNPITVQTYKNLTKPYVVAVTAYSLKEDRDKYLQMGFNDYILTCDSSMNSRLSLGKKSIRVLGVSPGFRPERGRL